MTDTAVKVFQSTDTGAPILSGTAGAMITVLDACLVNGYNSVTLTSLAVSGNIATATKANHGFSAIGTVGPVVRIAGATPSGLNGDWRVDVIDADTFTFATTSISDQAATGTITAKRAPAGFSKAFSGINKSAYRSDDINSSRLYLRVDDTYSQYPALIMYESMSTMDSGTGPSPTSGSFYTAKSNAANSTARAWRLFADERFFYLFIDADSSNWPSGLSFGDIVSYLPADAFCAALIAHNTAAMNYNNLYLLSNTQGSLLARSYSQTGGAIDMMRYSHARSGSNIGLSGQAYPSPVDNSFHAWPVEAWESVAAVGRGMIPGLWNPLHASNPADGSIISDIPSLPGRSLMIQSIASSRRCAIDISGPWR